MDDVLKSDDGMSQANSGVINDWQNYSEEYNVSEEGDEEQFHKEQEQLFQQMSKNFALGLDSEASGLRGKLKENIVQEYGRLNAKLEYVPPRLPEIENEIKEGVQILEKSLMENGRGEYDSLSVKLWSLREEMEKVKEDMGNKRDKVREKIENFRKRYGNLVPQQQN
jgi:hypothetical protein